MTMKNNDLKVFDLNTKIKQAMQSEDEGALAQVFTEFANEIQQQVLADVKTYQETQDKEILQKRGIHTLTQKETEFYQAWINAAKSSNPRQALTNLDIALPFTVIDNVTEDLKSNHPLLNVIDFQTLPAITKMLINKQGKQLAVWGKITSAITKQLEGNIAEIDLREAKLSAFIPVSKDMLQVGPQWIDAYVRAVLSEAVAYGLEEGIINGNGLDQPIGMIKDISDGVSISSSTGYPDKTATKITDLTDETIGALLAELAKDPVDSKKARTINANDVVLICNPFDYFKTVGPTINARRRLNAYTNVASDPFDIQNVIQSEQMEEGKAVIGLAPKYKMGLGTGSNKGGSIEYSDEYKFLEDERYYLVKLIGNGRAVSNNDFILLDISKLKPTSFPVTITGTVATKEQA